MIDWDKPTALMLGRWQPWQKTGQVIIMVRSMPISENNPYDFEKVKEKIKYALREYRGKFEVIQAPNITNICYGRDVGYKIEQIELPKEIQAISATKIRSQSL
jgi:hypothetical protein